jgi:hypothetical protein
MRKKLDVQHFLGIYQIRKRCQDEGITNPSQEVKDTTKLIIERLSELQSDEEIKIVNQSLVRLNGEIIATFAESNSKKQ